MRCWRSIVVVAAVTLVAAGCFAQLGASGSGTSASGLPSVAQVESAMRRTLGYDPGVTWQIYDVRWSAIPGVADILLSINKGTPQHIYYSPKNASAIVGELIPFGEDPFAPARQKLQAADGPALGSGAPVMSIVVFTELECPHCRAAQPLLEKLAGDFPQVRFTFQQFPLPPSMHPWATKASHYAECARDSKKYWTFVDAVFSAQSTVTADNADAQLQRIANEAGLDGRAIAGCAAGMDSDARVKRSLALGESLDVTEVPTMFVNGRRVTGIADIPYDKLKLLVQFEIDHAGR